MEKQGLFSICVLMGVGTAACGGDDGPCDPVAATGCEDGQVCEVVSGGEPQCFAPVVLRGKVFAMASGAGVAGARVVALDANGAPQSTVAVSATDGAYELRVPSERMTDGAVLGRNVTLRADAATYVSFPSGIRTALPIDTRTATLVSDKLVIMSALTDVGLVALPSAPAGSIAGKVQAPPAHGGVLVVAESGDAVATAVADRDGDYKIFNLAPGAWTVKAYAQGSNYTPVEATVAAAAVTANLDLSTAAASKVTGSISIVDPEGAGATSVILVVESTFDDLLARGETPPGLRAGNVTNAFTIEGVPAGRYVVLAGFENDGLVRDPDTSIGGTQIVHIAVQSGADTAAGTGFKVTGARDTIAPGRDLPEMVTGKPILTWEDDSSEDAYRLLVFDALGNKVVDMEVPRETSRDPSVPYEGPLEKGMVYQFRAISLRGPTGDRVPISSTEDLRGVFFMP